MLVFGTLVMLGLLVMWVILVMLAMLVLLGMIVRFCSVSLWWCCLRTCNPQRVGLSGFQALLYLWKLKKNGCATAPVRRNKRASKAKRLDSKAARAENQEMLKIAETKVQKQQKQKTEEKRNKEPKEKTETFPMRIVDIDIHMKYTHIYA